MDTPAPLRRLCRYTTVPILIDYLIRREITLLPPSTWEDRSDAGICDDYRRRRGLDRLLAACFTTAPETIHHWSTFAAGPAGCCLELSPRILDLWSTLPGLRHGPVRYVSLRESPAHSPAPVPAPVQAHANLPHEDPQTQHLPFLKRLPYRIEAEYRVLSEGAASAPHASPFVTALPLPAAYLRRITITQRMPKPVFDSLKKALKPLIADTPIKVHRSTLLDNPTWQSRQTPPIPPAQ